MQIQCATIRASLWGPGARSPPARRPPRCPRRRPAGAPASSPPPTASNLGAVLADSPHRFASRPPGGGRAGGPESQLDPTPLRTTDTSRVGMPLAISAGPGTFSTFLLPRASQIASSPASWLPAAPQRVGGGRARCGGTGGLVLGRGLVLGCWNMEDPQQGDPIGCIPMYPNASQCVFVLAGCLNVSSSGTSSKSRVSTEYRGPRRESESQNIIQMVVLNLQSRVQ